MNFNKVCATSDHFTARWVLYIMKSACESCKTQKSAPFQMWEGQHRLFPTPNVVTSLQIKSQQTNLKSGSLQNICLLIIAQQEGEDGRVSG